MCSLKIDINNLYQCPSLIFDGHRKCVKKESLQRWSILVSSQLGMSFRSLFIRLFWIPYNMIIFRGKSQLCATVETISRSSLSDSLLHCTVNPSYEDSKRRLLIFGFNLLRCPIKFHQDILHDIYIALQSDVVQFHWTLSVSVDVI